MPYGYRAMADRLTHWLRADDLPPTPPLHQFIGNLAVRMQNLGEAGQRMAEQAANLRAMTGAEIAERNDEAALQTQQVLNAIFQDAHAEILQMAPRQPWIGADPGDPRGDQSALAVVAPIPKEKAPDPRLAAERLLRTVLPSDLCISLSAIGSCDVKGKSGNMYKLQKNKKTECTKRDGSVHSCCIGLIDTQAPDTDRIIAEFILITSDEPKYLATANLTRISNGNVNEWERMAQNAMPPLPYIMYDPAQEPQPYRTTNAAPRYPRYDQGVYLQGICNEMFQMVFNSEHLNRPFPDFQNDRWRGLGDLRCFTTRIDMTIEDFANLNINHIRERYLRASAAHLSDQLSPARINLLGFVRQPLTMNVDASCEAHHDGKSIQLVRRLDIVNYTYITQFDIMAVVGR